jgi:hypothetical protein
MPIRISPRHTADEFSQHWTLDDKIEVFVDRIQGWHLGVAKEIIQRDIPDRDLALLHIVASFFEMISKYNSGFEGHGNSKEHFQKGVQLVFPGIGVVEKTFLDSLYASIRNGLYHVGRPAPNVIIDRNLPGSVGYDEHNNIIKISPDQLVEDLWIRFEAYARALRDPSHLELRRNFEKRFDADNDLAPLSIKKKRNKHFKSAA